jgi:hypothetical protein
MKKTVATKMGIRENSKVLFINAPEEAIETMKLPQLEISSKLEGAFDYLHLFTENQEELINYFPKLKDVLSQEGMLWISWPKGGKLGTNLNMKTVIKIGYDNGLVESTCLSIMDIWSGLKFTFPKKGKIYKNSYGKLNLTKTKER